MTTDERIENLEKGLASARRFNRWLLAALGLAFGVWILAGTFGPTMAAAPGVGGAVKEVRANRFVVEDENGRVRAVLSADKGESALNLYDAASKPRAILVVTPDGPGLWLYDAAGKERVSLDLEVRAAPRLRTGDAASKTRAQLGALAATGVPGLTLYDAAGNPRAVLNVALGVSRLLLVKETGSVWSAP